MSAGLTNAWEGLRTAYGAKPIATTLGTAGAGLGLKGLLGTIGSFAGTPLGGMVISMLGSQLLGALMPDKQSPYERNLASLITNLQKQAAGMPTPATKMQGNLLNREVSRAMQSTAASATRAMPSGKQYGQTAPARVAQNRLQGARIEGLANIMGQSSINAQNQLAQIYGMQGDLEAREAQSKANVNRMIGEIVGSFTQPKFSQDPYEKQIQELLVGWYNNLQKMTTGYWGGQTPQSSVPQPTGNTLTTTGMRSAPEQEIKY